MDLLFSDKLAPITSHMGFIEAECEVVAKHFVDWEQEIKSKWGQYVESYPVSESIESVLRRLLPLVTSPRTRYLLIPTRSRWTAYLDNGYRGTDPSAISYLARRIKCRSIFMVAAPHTLSKTGIPRRGRQGAVIFELYGPDDTDWLNHIRSIRAFNDAGKWEFHERGAMLPFENPEAYGARYIRDRFTFEMLRDYLKALGLSPFEEDFYLPPDDNVARLIELRGKLPPKMKEFTLEQVRANY